MNINDLPVEDRKKIAEDLERFNYKCSQCTSNKLALIGGISFLQFADITKKPAKFLGSGIPVFSLICDVCGNMIFISAQSILPHYFKNAQTELEHDEVK